MPLTALNLGKGPPPVVPKWRPHVLLAVPVALIALVLLAFCPLLFGEPIRPGTVRIVLSPQVSGDCEVQRSLEWLKRIYGPGFQFLPTVGTEPAISVAEPRGVTIYIEADPGQPHAGVSGSDHGCRRTRIDPGHINFGKRTLAHEFGHQRWGDIGLPAWAGYPLNWLCDVRNDSIIWWCT